MRVGGPPLKARGCPPNLLRKSVPPASADAARRHACAALTDAPPTLVEAVFSFTRTTAKGSFDDLHDHRTSRSDRADRGSFLLGLREHRPALGGASRGAL